MRKSARLTRKQFLHVACLGLLCGGGAHAAAPARPSVAVAFLERASGLQPEAVVQIAHRLSSELDATGAFAVLHHAEVRAQLQTHGFVRLRHASHTVAAREAGRLLGVQYVVVGRAGRTDNVTELDTRLVRVADGATLHTARTIQTGALETSIERAAAHNARMLAAAPVDVVAAARPAPPPAPSAPLPAVYQPQPTRLSSPVAPETPPATRRPFWPQTPAWTASPALQRVGLGARIKHFRLTDDRADSFLGTINALEEEQRYLPPSFFVDYTFSPRWRLELTLWDRVEIVTRTNTGKSDGDVSLQGPILSVYRLFPNRSDFEPYVGVGAAFWSAHFYETQHWHLGYSDPEEYAAAGSPTTPLGDRVREMDTSGEIGWLLAAGCDWHVRPHWHIDAQARYLEATATARFISRVHGGFSLDVDGEFPADHLALLVGVRYTPEP